MDFRSDESFRVMRGSSSRRSIIKRWVVSYRMRAAAWSWWANAETLDFPPDFVSRFRAVPALRREKDVLIDQFRYRFRVTEEGEHGMYLVTFRQAFNMVGLVAFDSFLLMTNKPPETEILRPLRHL